MYLSNEKNFFFASPYTLPYLVPFLGKLTPPFVTLQKIVLFFSYI